MVTVTSDLMWIKSFLATMQVFLSQAIQLFCDHQTTLHIAKNPVFYERTKHIETDCHFVREHLASGKLVTRYVSSKNQVADIFMKALGKQQFILLLSRLDIVNPHAPP